MITLWSYCCQFSTYLENHGVDMWWAKLTCGGLIQAPSRHDGLHEWRARYKAIMITHFCPIWTVMIIHPTITTTLMIIISSNSYQYCLIVDTKHTILAIFNPLDSLEPMASRYNEPATALSTASHTRSSQAETELACQGMWLMWLQTFKHPSFRIPQLRQSNLQWMTTDSELCVVQV